MGLDQAGRLARGDLRRAHRPRPGPRLRLPGVRHPAHPHLDRQNKRADYVRTAVAKGLPRHRVISRHLLRNSLIPVVTFIGADIGALMGGAIILITHDLGVVADVADKIAVMYAGRIVEQAPVHEIYKAPAHPYTQRPARLHPAPGPGRARSSTRSRASRPTCSHPPGCAFNPRCPMAQDVCRTDEPPLYDVTESPVPRASACHFWKECLHG
ncbi:hypothetical protein STANM309S_06258 [Streptomyces tanashiensis]